VCPQAVCECPGIVHHQNPASDWESSLLMLAGSLSRGVLPRRRFHRVEHLGVGHVRENVAMNNAAWQQACGPDIEVTRPLTPAIAGQWVRRP